MPLRLPQGHRERMDKHTKRRPQHEARRQKDDRPRTRLDVDAWYRSEHDEDAYRVDRAEA